MKALAIFSLLFIFFLSSELDAFAYLLLLIYLAYLFALQQSPTAIGKRGEKRVRNTLDSFAKGRNDYSSFHDLTLKTPDGTTQIDHVLLSPYGIFVIETKNYKGWIFGGEKQKTWTQTIYRKKNKFMNPLRQNFKHMKALECHLGASIKDMISVAVFVGDCTFKTEKPGNVLILSQLVPFILLHKEPRISSDIVDVYIKKLSNPVLTAPENESEHLSNLRQNEAQPSCPRCGKPMVIRTASRGSNAGREFWGCSDFPSCKGTRSI